MSSFVFLCGCLEMGKDGVGDYSRRLGSELIRQGHQVSIVAINDKYINDEKLEEYQEDAETKIETLRLSSIIDVNTRFLYAKEWIDKKRPEWVSLQFVPYSFHKKGLPFHLPNKLRFLTEDTKVHVMFHEPMVWIGYTKVFSIKNTLVGTLQKIIIKRLVTKCRPDIINTSNQLYQLLLARISVRASILPLFSNIKVKTYEPPHPDNLSGLNMSNRDNYWIFVFFGRIRGELNENYLFENIVSIAEKSKKCVTFIFLGELGKNGDEKYYLWQKDYPKINFIKTGFQNDDSISWYLSISDFAVTNVPPELADRSGTIAAFKEHGLPIIFTREELNWKFEVNINYNDSYILMGDISRFNNYKKSNKNYIQLKSVAHSFMNQIMETQL